MLLQIFLISNKLQKRTHSYLGLPCTFVFAKPSLNNKSKMLSKQARITLRCVKKLGVATDCGCCGQCAKAAGARVQQQNRQPRLPSLANYLKAACGLAFFPHRCHGLKLLLHMVKVLFILAMMPSLYIKDARSRASVAAKRSFKRLRSVSILVVSVSNASFRVAMVLLHRLRNCSGRSLADHQSLKQR